MSPHTVSSIKAEIVAFFFFDCAGSPLFFLSFSSCGKQWLPGTESRQAGFSSAVHGLSS